MDISTDPIRVGRVPSLVEIMAEAILRHYGPDAAARVAALQTHAAILPEDVARWVSIEARLAEIAGDRDVAR